MRNIDLVKNLRKFQQISPNNDWAVSARANLVNHIENIAQETRDKRQETSWLSMSFPRTVFPVFSGVLALFVAILGSVTLSMNSGVVFEDFEALHGQFVSINPDTATSAPSQTQAKRFTSSIPNNGNSESISDDQENRTYASIRVYDSSDMATAMKAALRERINRASVLGYDSGNSYIVELANEADELYELGDYDAALRVISVAESMM